MKGQWQSLYLASALHDSLGHTEFPMLDETEKEKKKFVVYFINDRSSPL
jgi:hypothetical protein